MMENNECERVNLDYDDYKRVPKDYDCSKRTGVVSGQVDQAAYSESAHFKDEVSAEEQQKLQLQLKQQQQELQQQLQQQNQDYRLQKQHLQKSSKVSSQTTHRHHPYGQRKNECIQWAESLSNLLCSFEGSKLFMKFLENQSSNQAKMLEFWFAVEGYRSLSDKNSLIEKFLDHYSPLPIDEERRNQLVNRKARINKYGENDERLKFIFDDIQSEVEEHINTYFYPKFLRSKLYLNYVQDYKIIKKHETEMYSDSDELPVDYSKRYASNENCQTETVYDDQPRVKYPPKPEVSHYGTNDVKVERPYEQMVIEDEIIINRDTNLNDSIGKRELNIIVQKNKEINRPKMARGAANVNARNNVERYQPNMAQDSILFKLEQVSKRLTEFGQVQNMLDDHVDRSIPDPPTYTHTRTSTNKIPMQAMCRLSLDSDTKALHKSRHQQMSRSVSSNSVSNKKPSLHRQQRCDASSNQNVCSNQGRCYNAESSTSKSARPTESQEGHRSKLIKNIFRKFAF